MKIIFIILFSFFLPKIGFAALLEDVKILSANPSNENFELKLQVKNGPADSFFFLDIVKSDPKSFEKTLLVVKKLMQKNKFRLDLDIPSFSASPSGSYYRSEGVLFIDPAEREPNSIKTRKKK